MKSLLFSIFLIILHMQSPAQTLEDNAQNGHSDTIRVMTYNIWNGFDWGNDKEREKLLIDYIVNEDPEVIALQELSGFTQEKLSILAKKWGHDYAVINQWGGYPVGITSKKPIEIKEKRTEGYGRGMVHVKTYGYDMIVTHLNPFDYRTRLLEANNILNYMTEENLTENTIVMGDLNAHSPFDAKFLEQHSIKLMKERQAVNSSNGRFDYSVMSRFLSYPLIDLCQKYVDESQRDTYPTLVFWTKDKSILNRTIERVDYILVTTDLEPSVIDAFIPNRGGTDYLSDHYPVVIDLVK